MNLIPKINGKVSLTGAVCRYEDSTPITVESSGSIPREGYILTVAPEEIRIEAGDSAGAFYARQTLEQLAREGDIPYGRYEDAPKFPFRSFMLDVSRHFFGVDEVKKLLDHMARLKMNTFHWHLSDDQGFRIESLKFPDLNRVGSWRDEDGKKAGGYYTQEEIRQVVEYASERFINIIPEIDLPGHTGAIIATMPELSCSGEPHKVGFGAGLNPRILCAGNEKVYSFLYERLMRSASCSPGPTSISAATKRPSPSGKNAPAASRGSERRALTARRICRHGSPAGWLNFWRAGARR